MLASAGIFATTIQAQDFKDTEGDRLVGRRTLPIVAPNVARPTLLLALSAWSIALSFAWRLNSLFTVLFNVLALAVGGRYVALDGVKADQRSFYLYNVSSSMTSLFLNVFRMTTDIIFDQVWLSVAHVLPAYFRLVASAPVA